MLNVIIHLPRALYQWSPASVLVVEQVFESAVATASAHGPSRRPGLGSPQWLALLLIPDFDLC